MRKAYCLIRSQPVYRRETFMAGLRAAGCDARSGGPHGIERGDVVVMWNRYNENHELACRVERAGGIVLVAENGYVGPGGVSPHDMEVREIYALAIGGNNGQGVWPVGGAERWDALGVELKPWRSEGGHILVCPNRSFGRPGYIMPVRWAEDVRKRLEAVTQREVRVRAHPGNAAPKRPLAEDLENAWACVIWSSSAGVHALIAGVPVICEAPAWICSAAAAEMHEVFENYRGARPDVARPPSDVRRADALRRLAWAQWHVAELAEGEPFRRLLEHAESAHVCTAAA